MGAVTTRDEALHEAQAHPHAAWAGASGPTTSNGAARRCPRCPALRGAGTQPGGARQWLGTQPVVPRCCTRRCPTAPDARALGAGVAAAAGLFSVVVDERSAAAGRCLRRCAAALRIGYSWAGPVSLVVPYDLRHAPAIRPGRARWCASPLGLENVDDLIGRLRTGCGCESPGLCGAETLCRIRRPFSRSQSFFSVSRLSCSALPLPARSRPSRGRPCSAGSAAPA